VSLSPGSFLLLRHLVPFCSESSDSLSVSSLGSSSYGSSKLSESILFSRELILSELLNINTMIGILSKLLGASLLDGDGRNGNSADK